MIKLLILDVDGCMTDGSIIYTEKGDEIKAFNVKDGLAIATWHKLGRLSAIITGRESGIVARRARELGIKHYYQGVQNKKAVLEKILDKEMLTFDNVAAIGDDINDFQMLKAAKRSFTPADAIPMVRDSVQTVLSRKGGDACVREMIDILVEEENLHEDFIAQWF
ncbi:MAG TPA: HAD family hydrolase [Campylobacteraceae bacterium]|nr:HAD family hydrolase [Campylobacteraceae bacterium]